MPSCSAPENLYLIALMGQSNMSGRGALSDLPPDFPKNPSKIWNFTNAYTWERAKEPVDSPKDQVDAVSKDKKAGVGPSLAIADAFVSRYPGTSVGLIPCSKGSTSIGQWQKSATAKPRDTLYGSCLNRINTVAPANGTLRAAIFWQGARDARNEQDAAKWKERFTAFVADLRRDVKNPDLPVIMLMLGERPVKATEYHYWDVVKEQQHAVDIPGVIKVEAAGYDRKHGGGHFTAKSQLAIGEVLAKLLPAP
jgi:hypothetical protein